MKIRSGLIAFLIAVPLVYASGQAPQRVPLTPPAASVPTVVPALVPFSGLAAAPDGKPLAGELGITFLIYKDEHGGEPLWVESQNVVADAAGFYKVQLGAAYATGLPADLFSTGVARWLEIQIAGGASQPRVLLASVPYALKAADAATLGGLPASAFVLAGNNLITSAGSAAVTPAGISTVTTTGGTSGQLPLFNGASSVVNSAIYQSGTNIGIGRVPQAALDINGAVLFRGDNTITPASAITPSMGSNSHALRFDAGAYNSSSKAAVDPYFQLQTEPTGNNTTAPGATFNFLYNTGLAATPSETGLYINPNGTIHFASGQAFPGTGNGDITGVTAGTGLTGGGTSGTVTLNVNTGVIPTLTGNNNFTGTDTFTASINEDIDINIDNTNSNNGNVSPGVRFGNASGEAISSQRTTNGTTETNQYGLDFWTDYTKRMSITAAGEIGIGTPTPHARLDVYAQADDEDAVGTLGYYSSGYGSSGIYSHGANTDNSSESVGGDGGDFFGGSADTSGDAGYGIFATGGQGASNGDNAYSAVFRNDIQISGNTVSDVTSSKVDHPSDPANKYLVHVSVQSSEMMNLYTGNITTDGAGHATVMLPAWFESENTDFRYQLTVLGQFAQAVVKDEISNGQFTIMTSVPGVKVSWQITAIRQDAYAKAHPLVVEQDKPAREVGFYQHPELYSQPNTKQTEWGRNPRRMQRIEAQRVAAAARKPTVAATPASTPLRTQVDPSAEHAGVNP